MFLTVNHIFAVSGIETAIGNLFFSLFLFIFLVFFVPLIVIALASAAFRKMRPPAPPPDQAGPQVVFQPGSSPSLAKPSIVGEIAKGTAQQVGKSLILWFITSLFASKR